MTSKIIGIDLGTTHSCVATVDNGDPIVIPNAEGSRTTPSIVSIGENGARSVGNVAKRQAVTRPLETIYAAKRLMGQRFDTEAVTRHAESVPYTVVQAENGDAWIQIHDKNISPPEIAAEVLKSLKHVAEEYLGETVEEAVITVPAYFDDAQRQATKAAGKIAGLEVKRIINEPTAASLAYGFQEKEGQRIAVYDLGGGTFDISILEISKGVFQVLSTAGDTHLGGEDIDLLIVRKLAEIFEKETGVTIMTDRTALQRIKEQAEKAKKELSTALETEVNLPFLAAVDGEPKHLVTTLKRSDLEILAGDIVHSTLAPCRQALDDAKLKVDEIDKVILVGGQTRMPLVKREVEEFFGRDANVTVNPDEVVALGAAIQAAALTGEVDEILLLDVTPLSLGVETGGGIFTRLIDRNTTLPTRQTEVFTTSVDNQNFVPVHVLQGERQMAKDNKTLAKFELSPIPPAPRGVPQIDVTFDIDVDGLVQVTARDRGTGKEQTVRAVVSGGLSDEQIKNIISEAERHEKGDVKRRELAELKNSAEALLYTSERACDECGDLVPAEIVSDVQRDAQNLRNLIEGEGDAITIRQALQQLEVSAYRIAESMYGEDDVSKQ